MKLFKLALLFCFTLPLYAYSGVEIGGTRVIYNEGVKQADITVNNPDSGPFLIQSWIEQNQKGSQNLFITVPPLFRLEAKSENTIKILNVRPPKATDRESLFWLNIKVIPPSDKDAINTLQISIRSRMKLFYRPKGLKGAPSTAYKKLEFTLDDGQLGIYNPTPYHISFSKLAVNGTEVKDITIIAPFQKLSVVKFNAAPPPQKQKVVWQAINDYGGVTKEQQVVLN